MINDDALRIGQNPSAEQLNASQAITLDLSSNIDTRSMQSIVTDNILRPKPSRRKNLASINDALNKINDKTPTGPVSG